MKFGPKKKMIEFCFRQSVQKLPEIQGKVLFWETYFEVSNINRKLLICSQDKIIMKFWQKKWVSLILGKLYENCPKLKKKCYFGKHTSN